MKILILCTGNSCRSQMAHGFMQSFDSRLTVRSAGTEPASQINQKAAKAMLEEGIDIRGDRPLRPSVTRRHGNRSGRSGRSTCNALAGCTGQQVEVLKIVSILLRVSKFIPLEVDKNPDSLK